MACPRSCSIHSWRLAGQDLAVFLHARAWSLAMKAASTKLLRRSKSVIERAGMPITPILALVSTPHGEPAEAAGALGELPESIHASAPRARLAWPARHCEAFDSLSALPTTQESVSANSGRSEIRSCHKSSPIGQPPTPHPRASLGSRPHSRHFPSAVRPCVIISSLIAAISVEPHP